MNTVSVGVMIALAVGIGVCVLLPVGGFLYVQARYGKAFYPFFLGALAFLISQIFLRLPLLQYGLPRIPGFLAFATQHYYLYLLFLAVTAGLFEETFRWLLLKFGMRKKLRYADALSFGIGHGGLEAILMTGLSMAAMLFYAFAINRGSLAAVLPGTAQSQIDSISLLVYNLQESSVLLGAVERLLAMTLHVGMTMIVAQGLMKGKQGRYLAAAILVHTGVDFLGGVLAAMECPPWMIESALALVALVLLFYTLCKKADDSWRDEET